MEDGEGVEWWACSEAAPLPLRGVLSAFLSLATRADGAQVAAFCRRFGLPGMSRISTPPGQPVEVRTALLAEASRGMWAALELADGLLRGEAGRDPDLDRGLREQALAGLEAVVRLAAGESALDLAGPPGGGEVAPPALRGQMGARETLGEEWGNRALWLERLLTAYEQAAGPVRFVDAGEPGMDGRPGAGAGVVADALPVILIQFAVAGRSNEPFRSYPCSRCGEPARVGPGELGPRPGVQYYGSHVECRRAARRETARKSGKRRYWEKKGLTPPDFDARIRNVPPQLRTPSKVGSGDGR